MYYVREDIMKRATSVARDQLVSLGVCVGKFTHSDKFRLTIGALELLAAHAKHKVRVSATFSRCGIRERRLRRDAASRVVLFSDFSPPPRRARFVAR